MPALVQITDTHLLTDPRAVLNGFVTQISLEAVLNAVRVQVPAPDAILASGDLVHDGAPEGYRRLDAALSGIAPTVVALPGNHDHPARMAAHMTRARVVEPVNLGGWQILPLDSHVPGEDGGRLSDQALAALDRRLARQPAFAVIALHHPPVPLGSLWIDAIGLTNGPALLAVLDRHPQVRAVVFGHAHQRWASRRGRYRLLGTPSTCRQFRPRSPDFAEDWRAPGYRVLRLKADGTLASHVHRVSTARTAGWTPVCG